MDPALALPIASSRPDALARAAGLVAGLALVLILTLPVLMAPRSRLTSDESLYAAEALNVAQGKGLTYTTGEPVVHRPPLFPALMALSFRAGGLSLETASWLPRCVIVANALLTLLLARRLAGPIAGGVAGAITASSAYVGGLGTTLFLDGLESTFILLCVLLLLATSGSRAPRATALASGVCLGLAVLTKESAITLAPLPLLVLLIAGDGPGWRAKLVCFYGGLLAAAGWWWVWVFIHSGAIYLLGSPSSIEVRVISGAVLGCLAVVCVSLWTRGGGVFVASNRSRLAALLLAGAWGGAIVAGLEWQSWDHPRQYLTAVPAYLFTVAVPAVPALAPALAALLWAALRAQRGYSVAALVLAPAVLLAPFALFTANRDLALRDWLPLLYVAFVGLGCACGWLLEWSASLSQRRLDLRSLTLGAVVLLAVALASQGAGRVDVTESSALEDDWDNVASHDSAAWLDTNVPPGTPVMSTRLYFSHLYFLTGGRYPVHQLPTVLVRLRPDGPSLLEARSTLFRWESLADRPRDDWLYLSRFEGKGYYVGLAEEDLIAEIRARGIRYFVFNSTDAVFSSLGYLDYFDANPAFRRVYERRYSDTAQTVIFEVDPERLAPVSWPLHVSLSGYAGALARLDGDQTRLNEGLAALNSAGYVLWP
jgi:4-amino-4-deoxy-L-arabinose transferase-like glycosyltransferase